MSNHRKEVFETAQKMGPVLVVHVKPEDNNPWSLRSISLLATKAEVPLPIMPQNKLPLLFFTASTAFDGLVA